MWKLRAFAFILFCAFLYLVSGESENGDPTKDVTCGEKNIDKPIGSFSLRIHNLTGGQCLWTIEPKPDNKTKNPYAINLFIHELFLHENDVVTVFKNENDTSNDSLSIIEPLRAQNGSVTIITELTTLVIKLKGSDTTFLRSFGGMYQSQTCNFPIPPDVEIIHSPIHSELNSSSAKCTYTYNKDPHFRAIPVFVFEEFNFTSSQVALAGSSQDGPYKHDPIIDIFANDDPHPMTIEVDIKLPSEEYFRLKKIMVDTACSGLITVQNPPNKWQITSPADALNNGSIITDCRVVVRHSDKGKIFGVDFDKVHFADVLDIIAVNDGGSELSPPLFQVTTSNKQDIIRQSMRSTGNLLWISFKPVTYASSVSINVTGHDQGGHFKGSGNITMKKTDGDDTIFFLEVDNHQVIELTFLKSNFPAPATLSLYDGFDIDSPLLASLHGEIWYPVRSRGNKLRLVATKFDNGNFDASFKGVSPNSCVHMSSLSSEDYILSGNCNSTCSWTIPPQNLSQSVLLLDVQYISLNKGDLVEIKQLDGNKTKLGEISPETKHVPQLSLPSDVGAVVAITRGPCAEKKDDIVMVGHSSYVPACDSTQSLTAASSFSISSPLYPDTYPVGMSCKHTLQAPKDTLLHLAFDKLHLAPTHCVLVTSDNKTSTYDGSELPQDLLVPQDAIVEFHSTDCKTKKMGKELVTSEGFLLNGTVADCGGLLSGTSGNFNTSIAGNKSLCVWKVSIPVTSDTTKDDVNIISYTVSKKDAKSNYELHVYDGASVREPLIKNETGPVIWSRTNNLIFVFKRLNVSEPSPVVVFKYDTISCNSTMQCDNKLCMHPDWRCNGINDCGDFTDERNCASVPVPPEIKSTGYTPTVFWICVLAMLLLGAACGFFVPMAIQKYRSGYRHFGDLSDIQ